MTTTLWVTTQFEGWHRWPDAPRAVRYLASLHRHVFRVRVAVAVGGTVDRELEFHQLRAALESKVRVLQAGAHALRWADLGRGDEWCLLTAAAVDGGGEVREVTHPTLGVLAPVDTWSCETWATVLGTWFRDTGVAVESVEVSEDGENGAVVRWS